MASHTHNAQVERLEVVDTGRRRRWSEEEKLRVVAESLSGPRLVSATARRYGISTSLLFTWRRACRLNASQTADNGFVPAVVVPDVRPAVPASSRRIETVLANRRRVIVDDGVGRGRRQRQLRCSSRVRKRRSRNRPAPYTVKLRGLPLRRQRRSA
jgi:transposase